MPIGEVDEEVLSTLEKKLSKAFSCTVKRRAPVQIQRIEPAYKRGRLQYLSSFILQMLEEECKEGWRVLGVVDKDLYAEGLNFVFGQARLGGRCCLISLYRLRESFYGKEESRELFFARTIKEAVHEIGHTLGLMHCEDRGCVMSFSNSIMDTDRKSESFCTDCKEKLEEGR